MMYSIQYDPRVVREDFKAIPKNILKRIIRAIETKLAVAPEQYGKPLKGKLKTYWKLRVGHCRVVYRIEKKRLIVFVLHIGPRKEDAVYRAALKRVSL
jgi:mRNA interferase RelE/StbE